MFFTKENNKSKKKDTSVSVDKETLLKFLTALQGGTCTADVFAEVTDPDIKREFINLNNSINATKKKGLESLNAFLMSISKMDSVKTMLQGVENQATSVHTLASSSEELNASIDEVASVTQQVADTATTVQANTLDGLNKTKDAMNFVKGTFEDIKDINNQMSNVKEKTEKINEIVNIVKGIAEQTNLLSLNAAIEAARAGEAGRGFAVVAAEVKKLAEHTKDSVADITKHISELQIGIDSSVDKVNKSSKQLDKGNTLVNSTIESINTISTAVNDITETISHIAANTQEQMAVVSVFTNSATSLSEETDKLSDKCFITGKEIFKLSKEIDDIRKTLVKSIDYLSDSEKIDLFKTDHAVWRWRIYNVLLGNETMDSIFISNDKACRMGKWYYSEKTDHLKSTTAFIELEKPHAELHKTAADAIMAYEKGDKARAEQLLLKMDSLLNTLIRGLDKLKNTINKNC